MTSELGQSQALMYDESQLLEDTNVNPMYHIFTDLVKK